MKPFKGFSLPRWAKVLRNLFLSGLVLGVLYILAGSPAFSAEQAFRRAERQSLVGPSEILAELPVKEDYFDSLIVADDSEGVLLFPVYKSSSGSKKLYYKEKTGDVTVLDSPTSRLSTEIHSLTVLLFHSFANAASGELVLSLSTELNGVIFSRDYFLKAEYEYDGFLRFELEHTAPEAYYKVESYAFWELSKMIEDSTSLRKQVPAEVYLYDSEGELIYEESLVLGGN